MKRATVLIMLVLSTSACTLTVAPPDGSGSVTSPPRQASQYDQTIGITTANKTRESLTQTFTPDAVAKNVTRICLINETRGERRMTHNFSPKINPLNPSSGSRSCANFPANSRVSFELFAGGRPAQPDKAMTYSTTLLAGGRIDLVWR